MQTYRLLSRSNFGISQIFYTDSAHSVKDTSTDVIKFYGHSLSSADYSYFQAIFDGVNLYESHTRLVFYYRPWKDAAGNLIPKNVAKNDMGRKVTNLLSVYGRTMDNQDHGNNLIHKLLIVG